MWNGQIYRNRMLNPMWRRKTTAFVGDEKSEPLKPEKVDEDGELVEFIRHVTLHCLRWLVEPNLDGLQR